MYATARHRNHWPLTTWCCFLLASVQSANQVYGWPTNNHGCLCNQASDEFYHIKKLRAQELVPCRWRNQKRLLSKRSGFNLLASLMLARASLGSNIVVGRKYRQGKSIASMSSSTRYAVLVDADADNMQASYMQNVMEELAKFGTLRIRCVYGDLTRGDVESWKKVAIDLSFKAKHAFTIAEGKGSMTIDALDILHTNKLIDGFVLVSSSFDFACLARRLHGAGKHVLGVGIKTTPNAFITACDHFIYIEDLQDGKLQQAREIESSSGSSSQTYRQSRESVTGDDPNYSDVQKQARIFNSQAISEGGVVSECEGHMAEIRGPPKEIKQEAIEMQVAFETEKLPKKGSTRISERDDSKHIASQLSTEDGVEVDDKARMTEFRARPKTEEEKREARNKELLRQIDQADAMDERLAKGESTPAPPGFVPFKSTRG